MKLRFDGSEMDLAPFYIPGLDITVMASANYRAPCLPEDGVLIPTPDAAPVKINEYLYVFFDRYEEAQMLFCRAEDLEDIVQHINDCWEDWTAHIAVMPGKVSEIIEAFNDIGFPI